MPNDTGGFWQIRGAWPDAGTGQNALPLNGARVRSALPASTVLGYPGASANAVLACCSGASANAVLAYCSGASANAVLAYCSGASANAIANCLQDAGRGYALAWSEAAVLANTTMMALWGEGLRALSPEPEAPRSWYRHPDQRVPDFSPAAWLRGGTAGVLPLWAQLNPVAAAFARGETWSPPWSPIAPMPLAIAVWVARPEGDQGHDSGARMATAWPMAFAMMAMGWPGAVARPAATAHAALWEAGLIARDSLDQVITAYRTDSGPASVAVLPPLGRHPRQPQ